MLDVFATILLRYALFMAGVLKTTSYWQRVALWAVIVPIDLRLFNYLKLLPSPAHDGLKYVLGCVAMGNVIITSNLMVFIRNPRETIKKVDENGQPMPFPKDLKGQMDWINTLMQSTRYVDTTYVVPHLKPAYSLNPLGFILYKLFHISAITLITTFIWIVVIRSGFAQTVRPITLFPSETLWENVWRTIISTIILVWTSYWVLGTPCDVLSVISVALGSPPRSWPDVFGNVKDATTVAKAWRRTWHQAVYRSGTPMADFVTHDMLGLKRHSVPWTVLRVIIVFAVSILVHCGGDFAVSEGKQWWSPIFFMLQPFAIFFEAAMIALARTVGITSQKFPWTSRLVGYAWVILWFSATFPLFIAGFWREDQYQRLVKAVQELF